MAKMMGDTANAEKLLSMSSQFVKNVFKADDKYTILLNNSQSRTFSGEFRSRRLPDYGWGVILPPRGEEANVSQCDEERDYCLNVWGDSYTEGAAWQFMFDVFYDVKNLSHTLMLLAPCRKSSTRATDTKSAPPAGPDERITPIPDRIRSGGPESG